MNSIIPLIFTLLRIALPDSPQQPFVIGLSDDSDTIEMTAFVDSVTIHNNLVLCTYDVMGTNGASRRVLLTKTADGTPVDVIAAGYFGAQGIIDRLYFTDRRNETMTGIFDIADDNPVITPDPEGGTDIELTDRVTLTILNHDQADRYTCTMRDNQVSYRIGPDGHFTLMSIRPKPNDIADITTNMLIYDYGRTDTDTPLTASELIQLLNTVVPR